MVDVVRLCVVAEGERWDYGFLFSDQHLRIWSRSCGWSMRITPRNRHRAHRGHRETRGNANIWIRSSPPR